MAKKDEKKPAATPVKKAPAAKPAKPTKGTKKKLTISEESVKDVEVSETEAENVQGGTLVQKIFGEDSPPGAGPAAPTGGYFG